ncbi:MAG: DUF2071 domain-containing protein [Propionibacteriales bacterium]|nr:DUF2071 domain-containing protein [Propionibacteriales bacterium]
MIDAITPQAPPLTGRVLMNQDWLDLTYVHWSLPPERVAALMPAGVVPDVLDGVTYLGLVPFRMSGAGFGRRGRVPYFGDFLETNLRLYSVDPTGRRGVVFLTLDCERAAVVAGARLGFGTHYRWARMRHDTVVAAGSTSHRYRHETRGRGTSATLDLTVEVGPATEPNELDHFLSARWGLHTRLAGRTAYIPNQHEPWPMRRAEVTSLEGSLLAASGFADLLDREPDQVAFSPGVHAEFGLPTSGLRRRAA